MPRDFEYGTQGEAEYILQEIRRVEKYDCEFWWPLLTKWQNDPVARFEKTPSYGAVIESILERDGKYCESQRKRLQAVSGNTRLDVLERDVKPVSIFGI